MQQVAFLTKLVYYLYYLSNLVRTGIRNDYTVTPLYRLTAEMEPMTIGMLAHSSDMLFSLPGINIIFTSA